MNPTKVAILVLLLGLAACGTTPGVVVQGGSPMIDVPTPPFPYNSKFCT